MEKNWPNNENNEQKEGKRYGKNTQVLEQKQAQESLAAAMSLNGIVTS